MQSEFESNALEMIAYLNAQGVRPKRPLLAKGSFTAGYIVKIADRVHSVDARFELILPDGRLVELARRGTNTPTGRLFTRVGFKPGFHDYAFDHFADYTFRVSHGTGAKGEMKAYDGVRVNMREKFAEFAWRIMNNHRHI